jgi:hypothetical protein
MQNLSKKLPNCVTEQYNPVHLKSNSNKSNSFTINYYSKLFSVGFNGYCVCFKDYVCCTVYVFFLAVSRIDVESL